MTDGGFFFWGDLKTVAGRMDTVLVDVGHDDVREELVCVSLALHDGHQRRGDLLLGLHSHHRLQHLAQLFVIRLQILPPPYKETKENSEKFPTSISERDWRMMNETTQQTVGPYFIHLFHFILFIYFFFSNSLFI